jgi:anti-sigma factor RsiW
MNALPFFIPDAFCDDADAEVLLNEYVDGELATDRQPELFSHLAACANCRAQFDALLAFRLAARQESLAIPPAVDAALFARLDESRRSALHQPDRSADRSPLGGALQRRVSVGAALVLAGLVMVLGWVMSPMHVANPEPPPVRLTHTVLDDGALYMIDPGVTVEAER